jgi:hypothetical protein
MWCTLDASGEQCDGSVGRTINALILPSSPFAKFFRFPLHQNQIYIPRRPAPSEARSETRPQVSNLKPSEHPFKKVPRLFQERRSVKIVFSPCNNDRSTR